MIHTLLFTTSSLSMLLASGTLHRLSPLANSLFLLFCLLSAAIIVASQLDSKVLLKGCFFPSLAFSLLLLFLQFQAEAKPILAEACVLAVLTLILASPTLNANEKVLRIPLLLAMWIFFVSSFAFEMSSTAWLLIEQYSRKVSYGLGGIFGLPLQLGPTAMGLTGLALCIIYTWTRIFSSHKRLWKRGIGVTLALICVNHFGAVFFAWLACMMTGQGTEAMPWDLVAAKGYTALDFIPALFILQCCILYALLDRSTRTDAKDVASVNWNQRRSVFLYGTSWFFMVLIVYVTSQWPSGAYNGRVMLYEGGLTSWEKPTFEQLGSSNRPGLFCVLPDYLEASGFQVERTKDLSPSVLAKADAFVLMNFNEEWEEERSFLLRDYVTRGGTLMVFADHTDMSGLMKQSNKLLSQTPIRINFDSAHFLDDYWNHAFAIRLHPANRKNWDRDSIGVSVGASLCLLNHRATPILVARYGFSDKGNRNDALSKNYLGDRIYHSDEPLGDIVLAAECRAGEGKVIVFGDTALLQMGALPYSHKYVADIFRWAIHGKPIRLPWALILVLAMIWTWRVATLQRVSFMAVMALTLSTSLAIVAGACLLRLTYGDHQYNGRIAYLDQAHVSACDHQGYAKDDGDTYLVDNLIRSSFIPIAWKRFNTNALDRSALMVSMAATKPYSDKEIRVLDTFMRAGGQLLLLSSDRCRHATRNLITSYGMKILSIPLGGIGPEENSEKILMYNANPLSVEDLNKGEIRCTGYDQFPVVVERKVGKGRLTMVADYGLFFNGRLEKRDWASKENIHFLKELIGTSHED